MQEIDDNQAPIMELPEIEEFKNDTRPESWESDGQEGNIELSADYYENREFTQEEINKERQRFMSTFIPEQYGMELCQILRDCIQVLTDYNVTYWMDGGQLLSYLRHNGQQMPFDDDADIGIWQKDRRRINTILRRELGAKYNIERTPGLLKVSSKTLETSYSEVLTYSGKTVRRLIGRPCVDFFYYKNIDGIVRLANETHRAKYPNACHKINDLLPLKEDKLIFNFAFSSTSLDVCYPRNPKPYVDGSYKHWQRQIVIDYRRLEFGTIFKDCLVVRI